MAGRMVKVRTNQISRNGVSGKQLLFVMHFADLRCHTKAAELAGYKHPKVMGSRLMDERLFPRVVAAVNREIARRESVQKFKSDDILRVLQVGAFLDPRPWFEPGSISEGTWTLTEEDYFRLPIDIARHIKSAEREMTYEEDDDGVVSPVPTGKVKVKLTDKETLIGMVAKHQLGDKVNVSGTILQLNWKDMQRKIESGESLPPISDPIEAQILSIADKGNSVVIPGESLSFESIPDKDKIQIETKENPPTS